MTTSLTPSTLRDALLAAIGSLPRGARRSLLDDVYGPLIEILDNDENFPDEADDRRHGPASFDESGVPLVAPLPDGAPPQAQAALNAVLRAAFACADRALAGNSTHGSDFELIKAVEAYRSQTGGHPRKKSS